jgi:hypothetical protein
MRTSGKLAAPAVLNITPLVPNYADYRNSRASYSKIVRRTEIMAKVMSEEILVNFIIKFQC